MEPQDSDKPRWGYGLEETPFSRYSYEQQKINIHKVTLLPALNIGFLLIIVLLSIWYYWNSILNSSLFLLINFIFFIINSWIIRQIFWFILNKILFSSFMLIIHINIYSKYRAKSTQTITKFILRRYLIFWS